MQIFKFYFNPKDKTDLIFESFCYEPKNIYEKKLGNLCIVGFLKHALPQNVKFLDNLAKIIKENYYQTNIYPREPSKTRQSVKEETKSPRTPKKSLEETLKRANDFLEKIAKEGDVSWLGNLSFSVISLKEGGKTSFSLPRFANAHVYELNFTKVGDLKIFLLRNDQIIDIDQKLKFDEIEPYPLKIFGNIVTGKLAENDIILVLSKETSEIFKNENLLEKIAGISVGERGKVEKILDSKKEQLLKSPGICLLIALTKTQTKQNIKKNAQSSLSNEKRVISHTREKLCFSLRHCARFARLRFWENLSPETKNKIKLVFVLILFLLLGYLIFN